MLVASPCLAVPIGFGTFYISLTRGLSHCGLATYIEKHHKAKEEYYGNSNILPCKNIIFRNSSKKSQSPSRYYNSGTNLKFQHKPKYHPSFKNSHVKINLLPRGQNPLSYYTL
jgi:hypothetical protein